MSTPRSTPGARGDERRARWHAGGMVRPPRTLRSTRAGLFLHDQLRRLAKNATFPAAVKVMIKTLSTDAAASTVPPAIGPDRASPSWARSEQMRSMFSVFVCFFSLVRKSVFSHFGHSRTIVERARAVRMSLGATSEAQGARRSGRTEGPRRGLSARAKPRRGKRVKRASGAGDAARAKLLGTGAFFWVGKTKIETLFA